jgi:hypothetical protein
MIHNSQRRKTSPDMRISVLSGKVTMRQGRKLLHLTGTWSDREGWIFILLSETGAAAYGVAGGLNERMGK